MHFGYGPGPDVFAEPAQAHNPLADWQAAGLVDEFGDRLLVFDNGPTPSLELLRFRQALTAMPGFEVALRRRVQQLSALRHPSFATVRGVQYLAGGQGLVLVSNYTPGRRLSEVLRNSRDPTFATALIRQLTPALASLHAQGAGIAHGALTASRIVVTPEGRPTIVEHVLGSAVERLELSATRLSTVLGIEVPPTERAARERLDSRTDFFQLGLIALSLLLGRPLSSDECRTSAAKLLDDVIPPSDGQSAAPFAGLRVWLQRALQLEGQVFQSSDEAIEALADLPHAGLEQIARQWQELIASSEPAEAPAESYSRAAEAIPWPAPDLPAVFPTSPASDVLDSQVVEIQEEISSPSQGSIKRESSEATEDAALSAPNSSAPPPGAATAGGTGWGHWFNDKPNGRMRALVVVLAVCAIAEGFVIATLLQRRWATASSAPFADIQVRTPDPGASVMVDGRSAGLTPLQLKIGPDTHSISVVGPPSSPAAVTGLPVGITGQQNLAVAQAREPPVTLDAGTVNPDPAAAPAPQRFGGIRLVTPIELEVFEGDRRLGSSGTGIVSAPAGRHELELVNSALGFRVRELVEVKGGQVVSVAVAPPHGVININALPWAEVWIDGKSVGQTPIGNLSVPLGEHEILFRHPQLGEQRQTAVVRLDGVTRVSANLERQPPSR